MPDPTRLHFRPPAFRPAHWSDTTSSKRPVAGSVARPDHIHAKSTPDPFRDLFVVTSTAAPLRFGPNAVARGAASLRERTDDHRERTLTEGVGVYFGTKSEFAKAGRPEQLTMVLESSVDPSRGEETRARLKPTHCMDWSMQHLGAAYAAAGQPERFAEITRIVTADSLRATTLAKELQKDGWTAVYYHRTGRSPGPEAKGYESQEHAALTRGVYNGIRIDEMLLGFETDPAVLDPLKEVGFWYGLRTSGKHAFVGVGLEVGDAHWKRGPSDPNTVEIRSFDRVARHEGLIMLPPNVSLQSPTSSDDGTLFEDGR